MQTIFCFFLISLIIFSQVNAQFRMMANSGPIWRQKLWKQSRSVSNHEEPKVVANPPVKLPHHLRRHRHRLLNLF